MVSINQLHFNTEILAVVYESQEPRLMQQFHVDSLQHLA